MGYEAAFEQAVEEIKGLDPATVAANSGAAYESGCFELSFFNRAFLIRYPDIAVAEPEVGESPTVWLQLTLLHYLTRSGRASAAAEREDGERWIAYRQLPGALSAGGVFQQTAIAPMVQAFGEDLEGFKQACVSMGGRPLSISGDAAFKFTALPLIPMAAVLYLGEEGMPASGNILFGAEASAYLPTEDLILIGEYLSASLQRCKGIESPSSTYLF